MRGIIIDAMQGETSAIHIIDARLAALAASLSAGIPGVTLKMRWADDVNDVEFSMVGYGTWLEVADRNEGVSLVEAALARRMSCTGMSPDTIRTLTAGTTLEDIADDDGHAVMADCEADMEGLLTEAMAPLMATQRILSAHAGTVGVTAPMEPCPRMPLDHLRIDADVLEAWLASRPAMSIVRDIRATMMDRLSMDNWHKAIDDLSVEMVDDGPMIVHRAMISRTPECVFDGRTMEIDQDLPDTILEMVVGRALGELVATGHAGIDDRMINGIEDTSRGYEIAVTPRPVRIGDHPEMAAAFAREMAENVADAQR